LFSIFTEHTGSAGNRSCIAIDSFLRIYAFAPLGLLPIDREHHGDVYLDKTNKLAAAGDWCGNARVESAFLHAKKLAKELVAVL
jgi:hypothetical protein